jgi:hypothetical protein
MKEMKQQQCLIGWVDIQLEARTQTVRRTRRDRADEYEKVRTSEPLSAETLDPERTCRDESVAAANGKAAEMAAHF